MKKFSISIVLAVLAAVQFMMTTVFAESEKFEENFLDASGIISMDEDYNSDAPVSRIEFLKMVFEVTKTDTEQYPEEDIQPFFDVTENDEFFNIANAAYNMGIIKGGTDGCFRPYTTISPDKATTILLRALYGSDLIENLGGASAVADTLRLYKDLKVGDAGFTYKNAAVLIYNALSAEFIEQNYNGTYYFDKESSLLYELYDIEYVEGMVDGNYKQSIYETPTKYNFITIDGEVYKLENEKYNNMFFGQKVCAYYRENSEEDFVIVYMESENGSVTEYDFDDLVALDSEYISYTEPGKGKIKKENLSRTCITMHNNTRVNLTKAFDVSGNGHVICIDNDGDGRYDILDITTYDIYIVKNVNTVYDRIVFENSDDIIELKNYGEVRIVDKEGKAVELANIARYSVAEVSISQGREFITITVVTDKISVKVASVLQDPHDNSVVIIADDGTEYKTVSGFNEDLRPGMTYTFALDSKGNVCARLSEEEGVYKIGCVMKAIASVDEPEGFIRLMGTDEKISELIIPEKVTCVNYGKRFTVSEAIAMMNESYVIRYTQKDGVMTSFEVASEDENYQGFQKMAELPEGNNAYTRYWKNAMIIGGRIPLNEDDKFIIAEIERIHSCGIRSVCLESRTHEEFCKDDWWSDIKLIFDECKKRDMKVWILDDKHFPSGYANGIFEEKYKHLQSFGITEQHIDVAEPVKDGCAMASCWCESEEDEIVKVLAIKHVPNSDKYSEIIDITEGLSEDMVYFDLPQGMWRIVFIIKTQRGKQERHLPFCDMLNPEAVELFIDEVYKPHYERFSEYFGNTFLGFFSDEPSFLNNTKNGLATDTGEAFAHYPWNDSLKKKIDMKTLAGLWFDIEGISEKVRYDYMDVITKEYQKNFCEKIGDWCKNHGVLYIGHVIEDNNTHAKTGHGTGHYFRALSGQDMSGIDVVLHQIVPGLTECSNAGSVSYKHMENDFFHYYLGKLASSLAHIDEKKKGRAMCEIFGAYGWAEGTKIMKYLMDHMLVRGINYFVPHAFSPKPNDTDCPPNFYDTGKNPQFKFFKNNMEYMNRMCYMLNDGKHIPTCAILYDAENRWVNKRFLPLEKIAKELYDNLLDYDIIPVDYLDKIKESSLNGEKYNVLIVPYAESIPVEIMNKLKNADIRVITVSENEWETSFENVRLDNLVDYMKSNGFFDVSSDYNGIYLRYFHYTRDNAHIYMFSNEDINNTINTKISLSAFNGGKYIEYDAFENKAVVKESSSAIELNLPPYHSRIIIFGDVSYDEIPEFSDIKIISEKKLKPEFKISVAERNNEEFKPYKTTDKLFNITGRDEIPHFSGHIKYEAEFEIEAGKALLDLGYVGEVAELYINDKFVGEKLFPPYRFDISGFLKDGKNKMMVIVSNHNGYAVRDRFSKYLLFEPSGLLGPIKIKLLK